MVLSVRIIRIIDRLNVGGPARHVTWLTAKERAAEIETILITGVVPPGEGDMSWFTLKAGVIPHVIPEMSRELSLRDLQVILKLVRIFLFFKPDLIDTHKAKAGAVGRVAALIYNLLTSNRCRVVHTYHGHIFHSYYSKAKTAMFLTIERLLALFATDRIITISPQQRHEIGTCFRVGQQWQHRMIPLGIDLSSSESAGFDNFNRLHDEIGIDRKIQLIGIVGRLCEVKNHRLFIDAIAMMKPGVDEGVRFVIIGDGHLRGDLESQVRANGLEHLVYLIGFRDDVMDLYKSLAVIALTSINEGTPFTLMEAMGCGVPVVSTAVGGVPDLMGNQRQSIDGITFWDHGLTVKRNDTATFARAMKYMLDHPVERSEMGGRASTYAQSSFTKERMISEIHELYRDVLR